MTSMDVKKQALTQQKKIINLNFIKNQFNNNMTIKLDKSEKKCSIKQLNTKTLKKAKQKQ